jgi:hypothetical protein
MKIIQFFLLLALFSFSDRTPQQNNRAHKSEMKSEAQSKTQDWKSEVAETLKPYGHRNWIVFADGDYPQQSNPAIKTITVDAIEKWNQLVPEIFTETPEVFKIKLLHKNQLN